jgi:hypothetical protein
MQGLRDQRLGDDAAAGSTTHSTFISVAARSQTSARDASDCSSEAEHASCQAEQSSRRQLTSACQAA